MEAYVKEILDKNSSMPNPKPDIERFSELHSWYKHLPKFIKVYCLLLKGEEPRNDQDSKFSDENQENYHWWFISEQQLESFIVDSKRKDIVIDEDKDYEDDELFDITYIHPEVIEMMKKHPIYFSYDFSNSLKDSAAIFQRHIARKMCKEMWEEIISYKK